MICQVLVTHASGSYRARITLCHCYALQVVYSQRHPDPLCSGRGCSRDLPVGHRWPLEAVSTVEFLFSKYPLKWNRTTLEEVRCKYYEASHPGIEKWCLNEVARTRQKLAQCNLSKQKHQKAMAQYWIDINIHLFDEHSVKCAMQTAHTTIIEEFCPEESGGTKVVKGHPLGPVFDPVSTTIGRWRLVASWIVYPLPMGAGYRSMTSVGVKDVLVFKFMC